MTAQEVERADGPIFPWPEQSYAGKRALDVAFALVALLLASPVMLLVALAVKLTSSGPILYRGERVGLAGRTFKQLKFRSMTHGAGGGISTGPTDRRVTTVGTLLRFTKLDELPQFINVLRGEMSIVGPRPEEVSIVKDFYTHDQLRVLSVRPGLTSSFDLRFLLDFYDEIPPNTDPDQYYCSVLLPLRRKMDLEYVERMSMWLDTKLILQTAYSVLIKNWWIVLRRRMAAKVH